MAAQSFLGDWRKGAETPTLVVSEAERRAPNPTGGGPARAREPGIFAPVDAAALGCASEQFEHEPDHDPQADAKEQRGREDSCDSPGPGAAVCRQRRLDPRRIIFEPRNVAADAQPLKQQFQDEKAHRFGSAFLLFLLTKLAENRLWLFAQAQDLAGKSRDFPARFRKICPALSERKDVFSP
jgi:hypothetical protein